VHSKIHCKFAVLFALALALGGIAARAQSPPSSPAPNAPATAAPSQAPAAQAPDAPAPAGAPVVQAPGVATPPQAATPGVPAPTGAATGILHGHISDPTGALIPGAKVSVSTAAGKSLGNVTADAAGGYQVRGLPAGSYVVQATFPGFAAYVSPPIPLSSGQIKNVDVQMAIEAADVQVVVTDEGAPTVSTDAGANASALVIKGADLDALSDDPDELSSELTALAGPSAGPNGGQIYIDGFTGGELPPKSAIREIRINQNPFSAEYDKLGYGRIEVLTKPGTDKLHGLAMVQGNDNTFNTGNPFTAVLPAYHSVLYNGTVSGAMSKWASWFFSINQRNNQNDSIFTATTAALSGATYVQQNLSGSIFTPSTRTNISPRVDLQLGQKNTLTLRYQFVRNYVTNSLGSGGGGGGNISLPSVATNTDSIEHTFQLSDSQIVNDHIVNETLFQYLRDTSSVSPESTLPEISVPGSVVTGGSTSQNESDHTDHYELQNMTTMTAGAQAIKFGTRVRDNRDTNSTDTFFNGAYSFPTLPDYVGALNLFYTGTACPTATSLQDGDCGTTNAPNKLTYYQGARNALGNVFDAALFFQDDWKVNKTLTLSGGVRWESQNHISDHDDWGPRAAFAYALDGHKKGTTTKTVLRGGYGFFFDRLAIGTLMSAERYNGKPGSQQQIEITNPTCFNPASLSVAGTNCAVTTDAQQIDNIASRYHSPTHEQLGVSLERQATKTATVSLTYLRTMGVHQNATIDANAYLPESGTFPPSYNATTGPTPGVRPNPAFGPIDETFPEAVYKENQFIVSVNAKITPRFSITGFYTASWANADTGTASNSYDLSQDYGRAGFVSGNQAILISNYSGPWGLTFNPFISVQSGKPFDIDTANDLTGDNFIGQDRPSFATSADIAENVVQTSLGALNTMPAPGERIIPVNQGTGPAAVAFNLRVSRAWGIGPALEKNAAAPAGGSQPPGGGHGGGGGGFGGSPFGTSGGGGRGGGGPFGNASTGRKYSLTFSAQALNLFNDIDYGNPNGILEPTLDASTGLYGPGERFEKSTSLAGGIYSSGSAARRIFIMASFQF
jgi:hypothetical protein